ncbi:MAG TPA: hypothetical protein VG939_15190 [Caulobacteraceae bacterium]|nr:hypothetical protein [Caulobacteraceae bacterium]
MGELAEAKLKIVRSLVDQAPDKAVSMLLTALSGDMAADSALARVRAVVAAEAADRRVRNLVLAPVAPLCGEPPAMAQISFPSRVLSQMWKGLKTTFPAEVEAARALAIDYSADESDPTALDVLCARAAEGLRQRNQGNFLVAAEAADLQSGAETLAACLDLAPVTRRALPRLTTWLGRMTEEKSAALRLALRDAVAVADDAGPRFFAMLAAQLAEPWQVLRVISGAMSKPSDTYLASSELGGFGESILADIEAQLDVVARFKRDAGPEAAHAAVAAIQRATLEMAELEQCLAIGPEGVWGRRLVQHRRKLATSVEAHLRAVDDALGKALPLQTIRLGPRTLKGVPRLTADPDPKAIAQATCLLTFMQECRGCGSAGGYASAWTKAMEILEARLDNYVEDILDQLRHGEAKEPARARAFLEVAADLNGVARDAKAAQLVRRRAAAA